MQKNYTLSLARNPSAIKLLNCADGILLYSQFMEMLERLELTEPHYILLP